jgi:hypothetical protein
VVRSLARACTLIAGWTIALGVTSCSLLLDWNGYTGGEDPGRDATDEDPGKANVDRDAALHADATDVRDAADELAERDAPATLPEAGPALCGPSNCGGCCNSDGFCAGGGSQATCGTGGEACRNCGAMGQSCDQGMCSSIDSGPRPTCDPSQCQMMITLCAPVYEGACCLPDGTCGCQVQIPQVGKCM